MAPRAGTRPTRGHVAVGAAALATGGLAYVGLADPHRPGFLFPPCPFKALTGLECPGCGGIRMTHDVLHGDFAAAITDNVFALVGLPLLAVWLLVRWRRGQTLMPVAAMVTIGIAGLAWTVVRNLPGFPLVPTFVTG
jgi:hypothetical protein